MSVSWTLFKLGFFLKMVYICCRYFLEDNVKCTSFLRDCINHFGRFREKKRVCEWKGERSVKCTFRLLNCKWISERKVHRFYCLELFFLFISENAWMNVQFVSCTFGKKTASPGFGLHSCFFLTLLSWRRMILICILCYLYSWQPEQVSV